MKALTIWQPWAAFVASGMKQYETRSWYTSHRGCIAIHAGAHKMSGTDLDLYAFQIRRLEKKVGTCLRSILLRYSAIVAVADLEECERTEGEIYTGRLADRLHEDELVLGDFSSGRYAWKMENVVCLHNPVPCKGAQGLWTVPADVEQLVRVQLTERTRTR